MRRLFFVSAVLAMAIIALTISSGYAQPGEGGIDSPQARMDEGGMVMGGGMMMNKEGGAEMAHGFPHPFFNHMGIPDMPGMVSARITGYRQGYSGEDSASDYGFHLEAGIYNRLGLHVRNNAIKQSSRTDVMLMYAVLQDAEAESGVSVFGGALIPSGTIPEGQDDVVGAFGVAGRKVFKDIAIFDGNVHYMPEMKMAELGFSGIFKVTDYMFPIIEVAGELKKDETIFYLLPALKFKLKPEVFLGVGSQIALTSDREFDTRALLQIDTAW